MRNLVIYGGRAYTAAELLRLLPAHPNLTLGALVSSGAVGKRVADLHPHIARHFPDHTATDEEAAIEYLKTDSKAMAALCLGASESARVVRALDEAGALGNDRIVVDLSGDFRLDSPEAYEKWYGGEHLAPHLLSRFDYCIPELHRDKSASKLVSNPGCFATAIQLALAPALRSGLVQEDWRVNAVTGSSGSGGISKPNTHHPFRANEYYAYKPLEHQHLPEVLKGLDLSEDAPLQLVTHSAPIVRGISVTAMFHLNDAAQGSEFEAVYREFCAPEPMLEFVSGPPKLAGVITTNLARLGVSVSGSMAVAYCAIDNLTRGASGQALQNLNRVLGWEETLGLDAPGTLPI